MLKLLEKNKASNDFMTSEYLMEVYSNDNNNNKDILTLKTNKYIYKLELPYTNKYTYEYGYIHNYDNNIISICRKYNISTRYYFSDSIKDNNIVPFDVSFMSEIGKYLPLKDYSHIF